MNERLIHFRALKSHPWLRRVFCKLSKADILLCESFILEHEELGRDAFEAVVNRMFMDIVDKPKRMGEILELLANCNVRLSG